MTITQIMRLALAAGASLVLASAAMAQDNGRPRDGDASARAGAEAARAIGGAQAPKARLAALIDAGGAPVRTKGVQSVVRIDRGVYCIRPTAGTNITPRKAIIIVSVDYFYSSAAAKDRVLVQTADKQNGCGTGRIGIYTLADPDNDGDYSFSNLVGFSVVVP